jgi:hypothetical protein
LLDQKSVHHIFVSSFKHRFFNRCWKWFRGSYLYFDLEFFSEASITRSYYSLFYLLLSKEMLSPESDMVLMNELKNSPRRLWSGWV